MRLTVNEVATREVHQMHQNAAGAEFKLLTVARFIPASLGAQARAVHNKTGTIYSIVHDFICLAVSATVDHPNGPFLDSQDPSGPHHIKCGRPHSFPLT